MKQPLVIASLAACLLSACATTPQPGATASAPPARAEAASAQKSIKDLLAAEVEGLRAAGFEVEADGEGIRVTMPGAMAFKSGQSRLSAEADAPLGQIAGVLNTVSQVHAQVIGHTDSAGDAAYNQKLSEARAQAVLRALVAKGVAEERLSAEGRGEDEPVADNGSREGRAANRRVEVLIGMN